MANISLWEAFFFLFLSKTIKPGHGQQLLVICLLFPFSQQNNRTWSWPTSPCEMLILLIHMPTYTYYTDDTAMGFSASKQKEGQGGVGDTPIDRFEYWSTCGANKTWQIQQLLLFLVAIWWDASNSCICLCIYFQQKRSALLHFILHESWRGSQMP